MKLFLIGAAGRIGGCILDEALARGHAVTGMTRDIDKLPARQGLTVFEGDVMNGHALARAINNHDAVIVSHRSQPDDPKLGLKTILAADSILDALYEADVKRVLWVGGAGSLLAPDGRRVVDTMDLPNWALSSIWSMAALLMHLQTIEDLDWTFFSPSQDIASGERTGKFRLGLDDLLVDDTGRSFISYQDYAVATLDELENPRHIRRRFTAGY